MIEHLKERTLGELFSRLTQGLSKMFRQEIELAKTEVTLKAKQGLKDVAFLIIGGFVVYAGFLALLAALVVGLWGIMPLWISALIVGFLICGIGYTLIHKGLGNLKQRSLAPEQTVATVKETREWVKEQL